jgi:hypothetical protein
MKFAAQFLGEPILALANERACSARFLLASENFLILSDLLPVTVIYSEKYVGTE